MYSPVAISEIALFTPNTPPTFFSLRYALIRGSEYCLINSQELSEEPSSQIISSKSAKVWFSVFSIDSRTNFAWLYEERMIETFGIFTIHSLFILSNDVT